LICWWPAGLLFCRQDSIWRAAQAWSFFGRVGSTCLLNLHACTF
jgi:hypothetical protein